MCGFVLRRIRLLRCNDGKSEICFHFFNPLCRYESFSEAKQEKQASRMRTGKHVLDRPARDGASIVDHEAVVVLRYEGCENSVSMFSWPVHWIIL